jgi:hypothetical protein
MDRTANSNGKTMVNEIDFKFFVWKNYFDLENVVSGENTFVGWRVWKGVRVMWEEEEVEGGV